MVQRMKERAQASTADGSIFHGTKQENALCHKSYMTTAWFEKNYVEILQWPPRSPNLNPIENLWNSMASKLTKAENLR